jgi:hypothetical protein
MVEKSAQPNGKDEVTENGVVHAGEQKRSGVLVGE